MIKAVVFDVDGILIDSEPFWREAEQAVFKKVGIELTDAMCGQTMGLRTDEVVEYWYKRQPWNNISKKQIEADLHENVRNLILERGAALPGVYYILDFFQERGYKIGLASSSPFILIDAVIEKLQIAPRFEGAASAENEQRGKPDPAVYRTAAKALGVHPRHCIAFEDSVNGFKSAKAAGMKTVVIPEQIMQANPAFQQADLMFSSMLEFKDEHLVQLTH